VSRPSTLRPTLLLTSGRGLAFVASFSIPVVLARSLGTAEFGTYKQLFLIYTTVYLMAQLGMAESLFYFVPHDPRRAGTFVANSTLVLAVGGAASAGVILAASGPIARWLGNPALAGHLPLLSLFLLLSAGSAALEIVFTARGRFVGAATAYCLSDVTKAACLIVPAALGWGIQGLLGGAVLFGAIRSVAALVVYRGEFRSGFRPDFRVLAGQLAYTIPMGLYVLVEIAQSNLHQYAVSTHVGPAAFAIYAVGCLQIPLVEMIASPACNVMMVGMRERLREGDPTAALALWRDMTGKLALMIVPLVTLFLIAGGELIRLLFTDRYASSVPIFLLWSCSLLYSILQTDGVLRVFAETPFLLKIGLMKLLVIAAGVGWSLSAFGLRGPVLVTLLATLLGKTLSLARMRRLLGASLRDLVPWNDVAAAASISAAAAIPVEIVRSHLGLSPFPSLVFTGGLFAAGYGSILLLSRSRETALGRLMPGFLFR
jgi:O-antigen/teichoic acid export membrane protein